MPHLDEPSDRVRSSCAFGKEQQAGDWLVKAMHWKQATKIRSLNFQQCHDCVFAVLTRNMHRDAGWLVDCNQISCLPNNL